VNREKKTGILLIVCGICFPLMFLPFVSGYEKEKGIIQNFFNIGIMLKTTKPVTSGEAFSLSSIVKMIPERLPFRFILAIGIFLIFAGIVKIDLSRSRANVKGS
jgi:hypothetical protein